MTLSDVSLARLADLHFSCWRASDVCLLCLIRKNTLGTDGLQAVVYYDNMSFHHLFCNHITGSIMYHGCDPGGSSHMIDDMLYVQQ